MNDEPTPRSGSRWEPAGGPEATRPVPAQPPLGPAAGPRPDRPIPGPESSRPAGDAVPPTRTSPARAVLGGSPGSAPGAPWWRPAARSG
ncbi:hypothetical protein [Nocardioides mesophilus]|uniref:Uncharacterized protein n=1 Tax=Nocardioides mesophilus TaxID=433659 RepID=A0A7G9RG31_9ACTN|nr:hypothetical protein [Nocardioides mesophilus]QNN54556.1 hypothetical protein H9L09_09750 [Nocardioides mesophilus]